MALISQLNRFLMLKVPSAWICGVRLKQLDQETCRVGVTHCWINQNPFHSMYFAVQAMAAELSTGAMVMRGIQKKDQKISMLVRSNKASFTKKATGKIIFECRDGKLVEKAIDKAVSTGAGQQFWMKSIGRNAQGEEVSVFDFEWTLKVKT